jgi:hypothetical protein
MGVIKMRVNPINKSSQSRMYKEVENTHENIRKRRVNDEGLSFFVIFQQVRKDSPDSVMKSSVKKKIV